MPDRLAGEPFGDRRLVELYEKPLSKLLDGRQPVGAQAQRRPVHCEPDIFEVAVCGSRCGLEAGEAVEAAYLAQPMYDDKAPDRHIVLPATTSLERNDIGGSPRDRFVIAMHQAIDPVGEARNDFDIFRDLARRLGCEGAFAEGRDETAWLRHLYDAFRDRAQSNLVPEFGTFWEKGWVEIPPRAEEYVLFAEFSADPDKHKLRTPSGRIELYSSDEIVGFAYDDCPPHPAWIGARGMAGRKRGGALSAASRFQSAAAQIAQPDGCRAGQR
jgi:hypothetical protein